MAAYGGTVDVAVGVVGGVGALVVVVVGCAVAVDPLGVLIGLLALICFLFGLIPLFLPLLMQISPFFPLHFGNVVTKMST